MSRNSHREGVNGYTSERNIQIVIYDKYIVMRSQYVFENVNLLIY